jgi:predicted RNA-binding protein YlxR (DUF448 family)
MSETGGVIEPQRTCLGCRKTMSSTWLWRLQVVLDESASAQKIIVSSASVGGRGAWLCRASAGNPNCSGEPQNDSPGWPFEIRVLSSCAATAKQKKAFARGFRRDLPSSVIDEFLATYSD